jgi:xanthine dehydrogenase YagT iron-sulfur-binding subunit
LSRRQFLKGSGVAAATTALTGTPVFSPAAEDKAEEIQGFGPGPVQVQLTVNGQPMETKIEPRVTLLDALRNHLDVTGCKRVCDRGTCGACTVMLDGKPVYSCTTLALEARGRNVQTAESLGTPGKLDAVPAAFVEFDAQQCGFCTPGFIMALRAALDKNPKATAEEVERGLCGNICRCGTYEQMRHAVASLCAGAGKGG